MSEADVYKNIRVISLETSRAHIASAVIARRLSLHGLIQEANVNESTGFTKHMWLRRAGSYFFPHTTERRARGRKYLRTS